MRMLSILLPVAMLGACATLGDGNTDAGLALERTIVAKIDPFVVGSDTAAYILFDNDGPADRLVSLSCDCADAVEIHHIVGEGAERKMVFEPSFFIPANAESAIEPPGMEWHLMLRGVKRAIPVGSTITMTLGFEKAGTRTVEFRAVDGTRKAWDSHAE